MDNFEKLREQQQLLDSLIGNTAASKKNTLRLLMQIRDEMSSLDQLKPAYPTSQSLSRRIAECARLLRITQATFADIDRHLQDYTRQKDEVDKVLSEEEYLNNENTSNLRL